MSPIPLTRRTAAALAAAALLAFAALAAVAAPAAAQTGYVSGHVLVGKEPAEGANIILLGTRLGAAADAQGAFRIGPVPVGRYTMRAQPPLGQPRSLTVIVNA